MPSSHQRHLRKVHHHCHGCAIIQPEPRHPLPLHSGPKEHQSGVPLRKSA